MIALRRFALSLAAAMTACASDGEDGAGSSTGTGGSEGSSSSADESSSSISSDESGTSSDACAVDVVANGECRSQGDACTHLDFACECDCDCAMPVPGDPGIWECSYARENVVQPVDASVVIDCAAGTIRSTASFQLDNVDGVAAATLTLAEQLAYTLTPDGGGGNTNCTGLCGEGQSCPDVAMAVLEPGDMRVLEQEFAVATCDVDLCGFCGGTASFVTDWRVDAGGMRDEAIAGRFEGVAIVCR